MTAGGPAVAELGGLLSGAGASRDILMSSNVADVERSTR
jgi:hypothetical protein